MDINPIINQISTLVLTNRTEALGSNHQLWLHAERTKKQKGNKLSNLRVFSGYCLYPVMSDGV